MPELPEVETIRRDLIPALIGRRIVALELIWPGVLARPDTAAAAASLLVGRQMSTLRRRGKYLIVDLGDETALVIHLRMTGRLHVHTPDQPLPQHQRATISLDDGHELRFSDQRKFGRLYVVSAHGELQEVLANVGPELLDSAMTLAAFRQRLTGRSTRLNPLLLDQRFIAGLGNIYADEALFRAGLHPLRSAATISCEEIARLYEACRLALRVGIIHRGTTFRAYRDAWGSRGLNQERLFVFRRQEQPCHLCDTQIERLRVAGRATHVCPTCQPFEQLPPATADTRVRRVAAVDAPYLARAAEVEA